MKDIRSSFPRNNFLKMFIHIQGEASQLPFLYEYIHIFMLLPLHVSALVGHLQTEYTIIAGKEGSGVQG
jgi:hypothetical protein